MATAREIIELGMGDWELVDASDGDRTDGEIRVIAKFINMPNIKRMVLRNGVLVAIVGAQ